MLYIKCLLISLLVLVSLQTRAFDIILSEYQINQMVNLQFPQQHRKDGLTVTLENPKVDLISENQLIAVTFDLTISDGENILKADLKANSPITYNRASMTFSLLAPVIEHFTVTENSLVQDKSGVNNMQSWLVTQIPSVIRLDKNMFNFGAFNAAPRQLSIHTAGVLVSY